MRTTPWPFVLVAICLTVGCPKGVPVPDDKRSYVGKWEGPGVTLVLTADGGVSYKNVSGTGTKEINAPLVAFHDNDFEVGAFGITTVFKVDSPPSEKDGKWTMTVDGVVLTRVL